MGACSSDVNPDENIPNPSAPEKKPKTKPRSKSSSKEKSTNSKSNPEDDRDNSKYRSKNSKSDKGFEKSASSDALPDITGTTRSMPAVSNSVSIASTTSNGSAGSVSSPDKNKKKNKGWQMDDELTLLDALKQGPPPIKEQVNEVIELLEELLDDLDTGAPLTKHKMRSRLNESVYKLKNLKIPSEAIEDRAARLAQQISSKTISHEVSGDQEVQAYMKSFVKSGLRSSVVTGAEKGKSQQQRSRHPSQTPPEASDLIAAKSIEKLKLNTRTRRVLMLAAKVKLAQQRPSMEGKDLVINHANELEKIEFNLVGWTTRFTLKGSESWLFDIFRLDASTQQCPLTVLMMHLFEKLEFFTEFKMNRMVFARWISAIEQGYNDIPYHNRVHAADVVQNTYFFMTRDSIRNKLSKVDLLAALVGAAIHDFNHPGTNNQFQVAASTDLALEYNDQSVLENMHCARAFQLLRKEGYNIFAGMQPKVRQEVRAAIITMVLSTDMKYHFEMLAVLQTRILDEEKKIASEEKEAKKSEAQRNTTATTVGVLPTITQNSTELKDDKKGPSTPTAAAAKKRTLFDPPTPADRLLISKVCMHCADLGNPCKPQDTMLKWTYSITEEFFRQGDSERELGLPLSPMMDRSKPNVEKSQVGFIDVIVGPLFRCFQSLVPEVQICLDQLTKNKEYWLAQLKTKEPPMAIELRPTIRAGGIGSLSNSGSGHNVRSTSIPQPTANETKTRSTSIPNGSPTATQPPPLEVPTTPLSTSVPPPVHVPNTPVLSSAATPQGSEITENKKLDSPGSGSARGGGGGHSPNSTSTPVVVVGLDASGTLRPLSSSNPPRPVPESPMATTHLGANGEKITNF